MAIILKTNLKWKFGQTNELPFIGTTEIGLDGTIEVPDMDTAVLIKQACPDFTLKGECEPEEEIKPKGGEGDSLDEKDEDELNPDEDGKPLGEASDDDDNSLSQEEKDAMIASLKAKSKKELEAMAVDFPEEEWKALNKAELLEYLIQKIS